MRFEIKKLFLTILVTMFTVLLSGQNLNDVINKHIEAVGGSKKAKYKTMVIEGSISQMGMTMDLKMLEKQPDKLKIVTIFNGMELIQVVNGNSGYMVNPMTGSNDPIDLSLKDISQMRDNSMLTNSLERLLKNGQIELTGSSEIEGEAAYELKSTTDSGDTFYYLSKDTHFMIAIKMSLSQMGQELNIEMRMKDFTDAEGITIPMKMDTYVNGSLTGTMVYKTVNFDVDIPDSEFEKK